MTLGANSRLEYIGSSQFQWSKLMFIGVSWILIQGQSYTGRDDIGVAICLYIVEIISLHQLSPLQYRAATHKK